MLSTAAIKRHSFSLLGDQRRGKEKSERADKRVNSRTGKASTYFRSVGISVRFFMESLQRDLKTRRASFCKTCVNVAAGPPWGGAYESTVPSWELIDLLSSGVWLDEIECASSACWFMLWGVSGRDALSERKNTQMRNCDGVKVAVSTETKQAWRCILKCLCIVKICTCICIQSICIIALCLDFYSLR